MSALSDPFRVIPLGVGDAFTELHFSTCLALEAEGQCILVDCPHPIRRMMRDASGKAGVRVAAERISAVILTHLHADHCSGLEGLGYFVHFYLGRKLKVYLHPDVHARLWDGHLAAGMEQLLPAVGAPFEHRSLDDFFDVRFLDETRAVECEAFSIECRKTIHHIPTTALRIRAAGRILGHSADTAFDPALIEWLAAADLVVHETNYGVHTPYRSLAELPAALRSKMRLIHYPDDFDVTASVIEPLREGGVYLV